MDSFSLNVYDQDLQTIQRFTVMILFNKLLNRRFLMFQNYYLPT